MLAASFSRSALLITHTFLKLGDDAPDVVKASWCRLRLIGIDVGERVKLDSCPGTLLELKPPKPHPDWFTPGQGN